MAGLAVECLNGYALFLKLAGYLFGFADVLASIANQNQVFLIV